MDNLLYRNCDSSLIEAVNTLIYAAPRSDVKELLVVRDLMVKKYGKEFAIGATENRFGLVNERVMTRLHVTVPDPRIVDSYLIEIADKFKVPYTPVYPKDDDDSSPGSGGVKMTSQPIHHAAAVAIPVLSEGSMPSPNAPGYSVASADSILGTAIPKLSGDSEKSENVAVDSDLPEEPTFDDLAKRFQDLKQKR